MQRRRRRKAEPKNIFGTGSQSPKKPDSSKPRRTRPMKIRPQTAPPSVPGAKPKTEAKKPLDLPEKIVQEKVEEKVEEKVDHSPSTSAELLEEENNIVEDQILGKKGRKDLGLEELVTENKEITEVEPKGKSLKARQIIQDSLLKASKAVMEEKKVTKATKPTTDEKVAPKKPQRKFRNKVSSYQPANRAKRLDRSRHMEYKYEMRGLLVELDVAEEHRSNLLATIWARGERQTIKEAKNFLEEKVQEGAINNEQMESLEKVVDGYTIRR